MKVLALLLSIMTFHTILADDSIANGKKLYDSVCFACHGKNLGGATGHNLKDAVWVHGGSKDKIMETIKKGFPDKGMVPFGTVFNEVQIESITNYILSRQEGVREMNYEIFHDVTIESGINWESAKPNKAGQIVPPIINTNLPEVDQFAMRLKGTFQIPAHLAGDFLLKGQSAQRSGFSILIDGKELKSKHKSKKNFESKLKLTAGVHSIEFRFVKTHKNTSLLLDLVGKETIPLSIKSLQKSLKNNHIVKANDSFVIDRKRVEGLPPGAIVVNHQDRISYAINPYNASISAIWSGESVDIGPNIFARGQDAAQILGKFLHTQDESLELLVEGALRKLKYVGFSNKPKPKFMYKFGPHEINIESSLGPEGLILKYSLASKNAPKIQLKFPKGLNVVGIKGKREGEIFTPDDKSSFEIVISAEEKKQ